MYRVVDTSGRLEWLEARREVLTATDIAALYTGGAATWRRIRESKQNPPPDFTNDVFEWGHKREKEMEKWCHAFVDSSLHLNEKLIVSTEFPKIGATPDMVDDLEEITVIGECKTSKDTPPKLSRGLELSGLALRYYMQVQVQLLVTGADACVFVWEQHDNDWQYRLDKDGELSDRPEPAPLDTTHEVIEPDKAAFAEIHRVVEQYFKDGAGTPQAVVLMKQLRSIHAQMDALKSDERAVREELSSLVDEGGKLVTDFGTVSKSKPTVRRVFDQARLKKENEDMWGSYLVEKEVPSSLRVTLTKEAKDG